MTGLGYTVLAFTAIGLLIAYFTYGERNYK